MIMTINKRLTQFLSILLISSLYLPSSFSAAKITSIDFIGTAEPHQLIIKADQPLTIQKQENPDAKQITLEIENAAFANKNVSRSMDTSSFNSNISMISPYTVDGKDSVRIVLQLKEMTSVDVSQNGGATMVSFNPPSGTGSVAAAPESSGEMPTLPPPPGEAKEASKPPTNPSENIGMNSPELGDPRFKNPQLDQFMESQKTRHYIGRPITLQVKDADISDLFRMISESSGFNIVISEGVTGKLSLNLVDVPWDLALDVVLSTYRLGAERQDNVLKVLPLEVLTRNKNDALQAKIAAENAAPRITRVFPISYATTADIQKLLQSVGAAGSGMSRFNSTNRGVVEVDNRTNSVIVQDIPDNIERMKKLIEILDVQTPQVMIEGKVVEASEQFTKTLQGSIGSSFGVGADSSDQAFVSMAGQSPTAGLTSSVSGTRQINTSTNGALGISTRLSFIPNFDRLTATLAIGESTNDVKVVSAPKTVVLNREEANVLESTPVLISNPTFQNGQLVSISQVAQAILSLRVKPTVVNDGNVLMEIYLSRDVPQSVGGGQSAVANRNMTSKVIVESGTTLMIGGIYTSTKTKLEGGVPILKDIPIIGNLFGNKSHSNEKRELFFFVTPRILNEKEAGFSS
jgi:type IV pilus assembly protein PilQ